MKRDQILDAIRSSEHFKLMCETFKRMTELDLWLDSVDSDDPRSSEDLSSEYYSLGVCWAIISFLGDSHLINAK